MTRMLFTFVGCAVVLLGSAIHRWQGLDEPAPTSLPDDEPSVVALKPARVFDGVTATVHENWLVVIRGGKIDSAGPADKIGLPKGARVISLPNLTLLPGLIDAHTHLLLHPYNE